MRTRELNRLLVRCERLHDHFAFDIAAACTGFVYALGVADALIRAGQARGVLVIGTEVYSRILDWTDRGTCVLFGDGAGAVVLEPVEQGGFLGFELGADGAGGVHLSMPGGGSRNPATAETVAQELHFAQMNGREVFRHAVHDLADVAAAVVADAGLPLAALDLLVPHQANLRIIEALAERLRVPVNKFHVNLDRYGNTSAAAVAIALDEANRTGRFEVGDYILMVVFGGGLTYASSVVQW